MHGRNGPLPLPFAIKIFVVRLKTRLQPSVK